MSVNERLLDQSTPMDYEQLMSVLDRMTKRYPFLEASYLGESILGRGIPMLTLGTGDAAVLYVGAHHGMEWITAWLLLRMLEELCQRLTSEKKTAGGELHYLLERRALCIVPMLNPDGVEYQLHGVGADNPLRDRLLSMNGGSEDFSRWQANARGVDLNHNYDAGFAEYKRLEAEQGILGGAPTRYSGECPESEPEVGYLCNLIRYHRRIGMVISLHTQGEEIYCSDPEGGDGSITRIGERFAHLCGYRLCTPTGMAAYGGLTDWCIEKQAIPAFTVECGRGENPLPMKDCFEIYLRIRRMLLSAPLMI